MVSKTWSVLKGFINMKQGKEKVGGGRQAEEVGGEMVQGERVFKSVQAWGWQTLEKSCRKTSGPFRLTGV